MMSGRADIGQPHDNGAVALWRPKRDSATVAPLKGDLDLLALLIETHRPRQAAAKPGRPVASLTVWGCPRSLDHASCAHAG